MINENHDSLWTISPTDSKFHPDKTLKISKKNLKFYTKNASKIFYRQQLQNVYHRNGVAYIVSRKLIKKKILINKNTGYLLSKSDHVSIDTMEDLKLAERILSFNNI